MKLLIIQGSPNPDSFCYANANYYWRKAQKLGYDVELVDLSESKFDPVLRYGYAKHMSDETFPKAMQTKIAAADHITFFFPIWWSAEPAVLKGWLDRVLTPKFAYQYHGRTTAKLLKGKTASIFTTCHGPALFYSMYGGVISRWKHLILGFCGIKLTQHNILGKMDSSIDSFRRRQNYMKQCAATLLHL